MRLKAATIALTQILIATAASAQTAGYPAQPVKVIVPFAPGGFMDVVGRIAVERLAQSLGGTLVVENRGGAGGKIGEEFVAGATPDGYTLLISLIIRPTLMQAVGKGGPEIDIQKAFVAVGPIGASPMTLNVSPKLGVKDFKSFIEKIRSEPDKHTYGSAGPGTPSQIVSAKLVRDYSLKAAHAPYRGGAPALQDVAAGNLSWMVDTPTGSLALVQANMLVPVMALNPRRIKQMPDVPTLAELGLTSFRDEVMAVYLMAPAATPKPVIDRLSTALMELQSDAKVRARLEDISIEPAPPTNVEATRELVRTQIEAWDKAVKQIKE